MSELEQLQLRAKSEPMNAEAHAHVGLWFLAHDRPAESRPHLIRAITLSPRTAAFHHDLGVALQRLNRLPEAERAYLQSIAIDPGFANAYFNLAQLQLIQGASNAADSFLRVYELEPDAARGLFSLAYSRFLSSESLSLVLEPVEQSLAIEPGRSSAHALRGMVLLQLGRMEEGVDALREAIRLNPGETGPYLDLFLHKKVDESDRSLIDSAIAIASNSQNSLGDLRNVNFALGKAENDLEEFEAAMSRYRRANQYASKIRNRTFDRSGYAAMIDQMIALFGHPSPNRGVESDRPIFVTGMYRSGTTLVEQILSSHPDVAAGGELTFWPEHAGRAIEEFRLGTHDVADQYLQLLSGFGAKRVTDKQPENFLLIGLLHALFPNAKIVCCRRNPVDNALSLFMTYFTLPPVYALDEDDITYAFREHERLFEHWKRVVPSDRLLVVNYEDTVDDYLGTCERLAAFCDLSWSDRFLEPEKNPRAVRTASQWQVRQPLYRTSVDRWRNYEPYLGAFRELLDLRGTKNS